MTPRRLVRRLLVDRRRLALTLSLVAFLVAAGSSTLALVTANIERAQQQSAALAVPPGLVFVEPLTDRARDLVRERPSAVRFTDSRGDALSTTGERRAVEVRLRTSTAPLPPLGLLQEGRAARVEGEAVVSESVARTLGVDVGDRVRLGERAAAVVGVAVDPAGAEARFASLISTALPEAEQETWMLRRSDAGLVLSETEDANVLGSGVVAAQTLDGYAASPGPPPPTALLAAVGGAVLLGLLVALTARGMAGDLAALTRVGMRRRERAEVLVLSGLAVLSAGSVLGMLVAATALRLSSDAVSAVFGQRWVGQAWPVATAGQLLAVLTVGALVLAAGFERGLAPEQPALSRGRAAAVSLVTAGFAVLAVLVGLRVGIRQTAPFVGVVLLNVSVFLAMQLLARRRQARASASGRLIAHTGRVLVVLAALAATIVFVCSLTLAREWHIYTKYETNPISESGQRPGALVLRGVADEVARDLVDSFREHGGTETLVIGEVLARAGSVESATPELVTCLRAEPRMDPSSPSAGCLASADSTTPLSLVFGVGILLEPAPPASLAAREILQGGTVGLLVFERDDAFAVQRAQTTSAALENQLGTYMPGVALRPDVAEQLSLAPLPTRAVYFGDFAQLSEASQAEFRAEVLQRAPSSQPLQRSVGSGSSTIYAEPLPTRIWAWSLGGSAILLVLFGVALSGFVQSNAWVRRHLRDLGSSRRRRLALSTSLLAPVWVAAAGGGILGYLVARLLATERWAFIGFGPYWPLPVLATALAVGTAVAAFSRSPRS